MWEIYSLNSKELNEIITILVKELQDAKFETSRKYFRKTAARNLPNLCEFNRYFLTKIAPSGKKIDNLNFNPIPAWSLGCQIVMINHH